MPAQNNHTNGTTVVRKPQVDVHEIMKGVTNLQYRTAGAPSTVDPPAIIPIDDIPEDSPYSEEEKDARKKLAACYRLVDYFKWTQIIYNHITVSI